MWDPLGELEDALAYMFELQKTHRQGKYLNPLVEKLKRAIDDYKKDPANFSALTTAISNAYPVIENYVDSYKVKQKMKALSGVKAESINVSECVNSGKDSETEFISWLSSKIGKNFADLSHDMQVQVLLSEQTEKELRVKLGVHLHIEPDFLFNLALRSSSNFIKLINSRLGFKFEKHQVARAISHHGDTMIDDTLKPHEQVDKLIAFLDKKLSPKGYSIEKLLNDPIAKTELEKMQIIQLYQSQEYRNRQDYGLDQPNPN
ncbi:MAG: hypothetical protein H0T84_14470 [Tatlockia sp.]|nr:hypothetical protein [Tatlockia sp.]